MRTKITAIVLSGIIILAFTLRFYKLTTIPPSLSWDEVAVGYNAWTILNWGKDEWGKFLPLAFKSFGEYKLPVHIYATSVSVGLFGLNELGVRAPAALFGVLNVVLIFLLAKTIFKSKLAGLIAALFLAVSPYSIQFSRFNHELQFALFFFMLGVYLIIEGSRRKNYFLILGFASMGLDLLTYNAAKAIVPSMLLILIALYGKELLSSKKYLLYGSIVFLLFVGLFAMDPNLLGGQRFREVSVSTEELRETKIYQKTNNLVLARLENIMIKYKSYFAGSYLFETGDKNSRQSAQGVGQFYKLDLPLMLLGTAALLAGIIKSRNKEYLLLLAWALLAPIPGTLGSEFPHAGRAMFTVGSWHLLSAFGAYTIINVLKNNNLRVAMTILLVVLVMPRVYSYLSYYFNVYPPKYAIEWQYGLKQVVNYIDSHPEYDEVYITDARQQPYIFFLFYLKTPLPAFLKTVEYNQTASKSANTVVGFGRYHFGTWDPIESKPIPAVSYAVTPSLYTGLRHKALFDEVYEVKYPDGADAFFVVSTKLK